MCILAKGRQEKASHAGKHVLWTYCAHWRTKLSGRPPERQIFAVSMQAVHCAVTEPVKTFCYVLKSMKEAGSLTSYPLLSMTSANVNTQSCK